MHVDVPYIKDQSKLIALFANRQWSYTIWNIFYFLNSPSAHTYQKTETKNPSETLAGPYENRKTGTQDPSGTQAGPYKNWKTGVQVPTKTGKPGPQNLKGTLVGPYKSQKTRMWGESGVWVDSKRTEFVAGGCCTRRWLRFDKTIRNLTLVI